MLFGGRVKVTTGYLLAGKEIQQIFWGLDEKKKKQNNAFFTI